MDYEKKTKRIVVNILFAAISIWCIYEINKMLFVSKCNEIYNQGASYIAAGNYEEAMDILEEIPWSKRPGKINRQLNLAIILQMREEDETIEKQYNKIMYLKVLPEEKNYELCCSSKEGIEKEYDTYLKQKEQQELAKIKKIVQDIPYVGMEEKYIDMTLVGNHDGWEDEFYKENGKNKRKMTYTWKSDDREAYVLAVICRDGVVTSVWKYNENIYWTSSGKPNFSVKRSFANTKKKVINYDFYDVDSYDDPDDFADEWAEEFGDGDYETGYDEAYDYWEEEYGW